MPVGGGAVFLRSPRGRALALGWGGGCLEKEGGLVESARANEHDDPLLLLEFTMVVVVSATARRRRASMMMRE